MPVRPVAGTVCRAGKKCLHRAVSRVLLSDKSGPDNTLLQFPFLQSESQTLVRTAELDSGSAAGLQRVCSAMQARKGWWQVDPAPCRHHGWNGNKALVGRETLTADIITIQV